MGRGPRNRWRRQTTHWKKTWVRFDNACTFSLLCWVWFCIYNSCTYLREDNQQHATDKHVVLPDDNCEHYCHWCLCCEYYGHCEYGYHNFYFVLPGKQVLLVVGQAGKEGEEDGGRGGAGDEGQETNHHQKDRVPHWQSHSRGLGEMCFYCIKILVLETHGFWKQAQRCAKNFWTLLDTFRHFQTLSDIFGHIWTLSDTFVLQAL